MTALRETGWAKINLALHVRGRRADGYHEIETLFAFVDGGDELRAEIAEADRLAIDGEFAGDLNKSRSPPSVRAQRSRDTGWDSAKPMGISTSLDSNGTGNGVDFSAGADNLVMQVLTLLRSHYGADRVPPLAVTLTKNLPVAAGIGGGSADAAAMARLVRRYFLPELGDAALERLVSPLGADIAACVASATCLGVGIGAELSPVPELALAGTPVLLVNPREPVATGPIFAAWDGVDRGPLFTGADLRAQLFAARNDLQRPAIAGCPAITDVLTALGALRPWLARMSGSGATCFALFDAAGERDAAALGLAQSHPDWWQMAGLLR